MLASRRIRQSIVVALVAGSLPFVVAGERSLACQGSGRQGGGDKTPPAGAGRRLDRHGDPLPMRALARLGTVRLRGGGAPVFSPDGKTLAAGASNNTTRLWEVSTGRELRRFSGHSPWVSSVVFSPDGKALATSGADSVIALWDVATGRRIREFRGQEGAISALAFSPDGKSLASGNDATSGGRSSVRVWRVEGGTELFQVSWRGRVTSVAFSPDGRSVVSACTEGFVRAHDAATGRELLQFQACRIWGTSVVLSPDGKTLATRGNHHERTLALWRSDTGKLLHRLETGPSRGVGGLAFSPDGKTLAFSVPDPYASPAERGTIRFYDPTAWKEVRRLKSLGGDIFSVAFSPDGKTLATGGGAAIRLWDVASGAEILGGRGHVDGLRTAAASPKFDTVVTTGYDGSIRRWDPSTGRELEPIATGIGLAPGAAFSPDGELLVSDCSQVTRVLDLRKGKVVQQIKGRAWVVNGQTVVTADKEWNVRVWEAATGKEMCRLGERVEPMALSRDGKILVTKNWSGAERARFHIWDAARGKKLRELNLPPGEGETPETQEFRALTFSPDAKNLAFIEWRRKAVLLIDAGTGKEVRRFPVEPHEVFCLAFSPRGEYLATGNWDGGVRVYEVSTGRLMARFDGHQWNVTSLEFSADGRRLISGSGDATALIWDVVGLGEKK